jgi:transmembrane 9 superfamily member 2/4
MRTRLLALLGVVSLVPLFCDSFYVPGWSAHTYRDGDAVPLWLNKVSSERTHLPFAYSELSGVCKSKKATTVSLNLGEILRGPGHCWR